MEQEKCSKCGCIQLAHTGKAGGVTVGFGMSIYCTQGYCISCINKSEPCFSFNK